MWAIAAADAARTARRAPPDYTLRWYNHAFMYIGICAVIAVGTVPWQVLLGDTVAEMRRVPNDTMAPALVAGDHVYTVPRRGGDVRHGDIVVYRKWGTGYIKRVAGVGGDTLAMRGGVLSVDQRPASEPYAIHAGEGEGGDRRFAWQRPIVADSARGAYTPTVATWGPLRRARRRVLPARRQPWGKHRQPVYRVRAGFRSRRAARRDLFLSRSGDRASAMGADRAARRGVRAIRCASRNPAASGGRRRLPCS